MIAGANVQDLIETGLVVAVSGEVPGSIPTTLAKPTFATPLHVKEPFS
jgi:hypothetical protein